MNKRFALDTNVLIYLEGNDIVKREIAENLLSYLPVISSQVITEFMNTTRRLRNISKQQMIDEATALFLGCWIAPIQYSTLTLTSKLIQKYDFQLFDSLIVASALEAKCDILYSEDMQHNLMVDRQLKIVNPFI